jgi:hypothetical protein
MTRSLLLAAALLAACTPRTSPPEQAHAPATETAPAPAPASASLPAPPAVTLVLTPRPGGGADTARVYQWGPLVSTAGWTSWVVSYTTTIDLHDAPAMSAQADSVFERTKAALAERPDSTRFMEAHAAPGNRYGQTGGFRFAYHRLPDGRWERLPD